MTALKEGIESDSLYILAGMNDRDYTFELEQHFDDSLTELKIKLPTLLDSALIVISFYLSQMINNRDYAFEAMMMIDNNVHKKFDWKKELNISTKKYMGEELGLEHMFTWYREIQDFRDGSRLLYYNELPKEEQIEKLTDKLISEGIKLRQSINKKQATHNTVYSS